MTDKEKIRAEIERRRNIVNNAALQMKDVNLYYHYSKIVEEYDDILRFIDSSKETVSEDLEKAVVEAFKQIVDSGKNNFLEIFKAGANWREEQLMAKAVEVEISDNGCTKGLQFIPVWPFTDEYVGGDKVKLIIIKED